MSRARTRLQIKQFKFNCKSLFWVRPNLKQSTHVSHIIMYFRIPWASVQLYCACNTVLLHNFEGGGRGGPKSFLGKSPLFPQEIIQHFPKSHITNIIHDAQNSILITNYLPKWRPFWVYNIDVIWEIRHTTFQMSSFLGRANYFSLTDYPASFA